MSRALGLVRARLLAAAPGGGPRFAVRAAAAAGRPFSCEAGGVTKPAARAAAARCRRRRPRGAVVVLDETGAPVAD